MMFLVRIFFVLSLTCLHARQALGFTAHSRSATKASPLPGSRRASVEKCTFIGSKAHIIPLESRLRSRKSPLHRSLTPIRASSSASLAAAAGIVSVSTGARFPWRPAAASAALFSLASLLPPHATSSAAAAPLIDDGAEEESTRGALVKGLRVAGTAAFLYFAKEYVEYYKRSEITAVLTKERMYKAEMYFDAVREILGKLQNPRLRPSVAGDLRAQLQRLDPQGRIQKYYATGADPRKKPDISDIVEANSRRYRGESVDETREAPQSVDMRYEPMTPKIDVNTISSPPVTTSASLTPTVAPSVSDTDKANADADAGVHTLMRELSGSFKAWGFDDFAVNAAIKSLQAPLLKLDRYARVLAIEKIRSQLGNEKYWSKYIGNVIAQGTALK